MRGTRYRNTPDDTAAQQPMDSTVDLLRDCAGLQGVQGELVLKARLGGLDTVLCGCVDIMIQFLNLFLNKALGYTWRKVVAKAEGCGKTHTWSIQQWVVKFIRTQELPSHQHGQVISMAKRRCLC